MTDGGTAESSMSSTIQFKIVAFAMIHPTGKNSEQTFPLKYSAVCKRRYASENTLFPDQDRALLCVCTNFWLKMARLHTK
jgi:hypothetical protein